MFIPLIFVALTCMQQKRSRVVFFGDSITEAAVNPGGYIRRIDSLSSVGHRDRQYEFIGAGVSGNKVYDLYLRMGRDLLSKDPSIAVIYIGVNDVWHKRSLGTGTDADKFEIFYQAMIDTILQKGAAVVLCTPAMIGEKTDCTNEQDGDLNKYSDIIRRLAKRNHLSIVDLRLRFLEYNRLHNKINAETGVLTTDGVHLNNLGNELVAEEMWKVIRDIK
jgi:lysophospholipase L1-like esterase